MPAYVMVYGYDELAPNTEVRFLVSGIQNLNLGLMASISVAVQYNLVEKGLNSFYLSPMDFPSVCNALIPILDCDLPTAAFNPATVTGGSVTVSGSNEVKQFASYTFTYVLTGVGGVRSTIDYLILNFPPNYFEKEGDFTLTSVKVDTVTCTFFKILAQSNQIFLRPNSDIAAGSSITIEVVNLPNPSYTITDQVKVVVEQ